MSDFHSYMTRNKLTQTAFAKRVGIAQNYLSEIATGRRRPSYDVALRIEVETGGEIPMQYWANHTPKHRNASSEDADVASQTGEKHNA